MTDTPEESSIIEVGPDLSLEAWRIEVAEHRTVLGHQSWAERIRLIMASKVARDKRAEERAERAASPAGSQSLLSQIGAEIRAERQRQVDQKGYSRDRDSGYLAGDLLDAAICYIDHAVNGNAGDGPPAGWPWSPESWRPKPTPRENLVRGGALALAEWDRLSVNHASSPELVASHKVYHRALDEIAKLQAA